MDDINPNQSPSRLYHQIYSLISQSESPEKDRLKVIKLLFENYDIDVNNVVGFTSFLSFSFK